MTRRRRMERMAHGRWDTQDRSARMRIMRNGCSTPGL